MGHPLSAGTSRGPHKTPLGLSKVGPVPLSVQNRQRAQHTQFRPRGTWVRLGGGQRSSRVKGRVLGWGHYKTITCVPSASSKVCQFSTRWGSPLCSEKPPRYAPLSKSEALGRNPGVRSSNNFSIKLLSWKDGCSSLLLTAPSTHSSPHEVKSLRALGPSSICVEQGKEETKKGSERHPQPALFLLPLCLGLCSLNRFQMLCRRKKQMLGCPGQGKGQTCWSSGGSPGPRVPHTSSDVWSAAACHLARLVFRDWAGQLMPNRKLLPTLGPLVGFALLTWHCCCLAEFWWQGQNMECL